VAPAPIREQVLLPQRAMAFAAPSSSRAPARQLAQAAREIVKIAAHLLERKAEREQALHGIGAPLAGETFGADRRHLAGVTVERCFNPIE